MNVQIKGYVRMEQQEEFEAWEKEQIAQQKAYHAQAEKESNDAIKARKEANGGRIPMPSYDDQDFAFRSTNAFNDY